MDEQTTQNLARAVLDRRDETERLRRALEECHDAICELLGASVAWDEDWSALPGLTGNDAWAGLKGRVDAALGGTQANSQ